jgi:hypothetical protein
MRVAALGGVAGPILFSLITIVCALLRPGYSHMSRVISELGASHTPYAAIMVYAGFVPAGLLLAAFGISLVSVTSRRVLAVAGSVLVVLFGLGMTASGIISCDPGCPQTGGSLENTVHSAIGPVMFMAAICGVGLLGYEFRRLPYFRSLAPYSFVTSLLALVFMLTLLGSLEELARLQVSGSA